MIPDFGLSIIQTKFLKSDFFLFTSLRIKLIHIGSCLIVGDLIKHLVEFNDFRGFRNPKQSLIQIQYLPNFINLIHFIVETLGVISCDFIPEIGQVFNISI